MATQAYEKAFQVSLNLPEEQLLNSAQRYIQVLYHNTQYETVENTLKPFLAQKPESPEQANLYLALANAQKAQKKWRSAFGNYQLGLKLAPTLEDKKPIASALAQLYLEKNQPEKALQVLKSNF